MQMQGDGLTIREMSDSAAVSRASYYRHWRQDAPKEEEVRKGIGDSGLGIKD